VIQKGIEVTTDVAGNMAMEVPNSMSSSEEEFVKTKLGVLDRLINTQGEKALKLLEEGTMLEKNIKASNPQYVSRLSQQVELFQKLNSSYKH